MAVDFLAVTTKQGQPIARCLRERGKLQPRPNEPEQARAEASVVARVLAGEDPEALDPYLVDENRLFQIRALPIADGDVVRGALVLGTEITDEVARRVRESLGERDGAAFLVGGEVVAASFDAAPRDSLRAALAGRRPGESSSFEASLDGKSYHVLVDALHGTGAHTMLLVSHRDLEDFRARTRALIGVVALAAAATVFALAYFGARRETRA